MASHLEDLDELILRCRNKKARLHIAEAVTSYRAGAFRASIVTCWIAVCFDVIEKLRELERAGSLEAAEKVQEIDNIVRTGDVVKALSFERDLLKVAKDKFELLSVIEFDDLSRLQSDRNRCAHPSLTIDDEAYSPSAELARLHLHSAITHLLQHPPVQGKHALKRILEDIDSMYFPVLQAEAKLALESGPLGRARKVLVRNLLNVIVKELLSKAGAMDFKRRMRLSTALLVTVELHPNFSNEFFKEELSDLFKAVLDNSMSNAVSFFEAYGDSWHYLTEDVRQRIQGYASNLPNSALDDDLEFLLKFPPLKEYAKLRIDKLTRRDVCNSYWFVNTPVEFIDKRIEFYLSSKNHEQADYCAMQLIHDCQDMAESQIMKVLAGIGKNRQVRESSQTKLLIAAMRKARKISSDEFERLLSDNNLAKFLLREPGADL